MKRGFKFTGFIQGQPTSPGTINKEAFSDLENLVDDGTFVVYLPIKKNWKCGRKGCKSLIPHRHTTYACLEKN